MTRLISKMIGYKITTQGNKKADIRKITEAKKSRTSISTPCQILLETFETQIALKIKRIYFVFCIQPSCIFLYINSIRPTIYSVNQGLFFHSSWFSITFWLNIPMESKKKRKNINNWQSNLNTFKGRFKGRRHPSNELNKLYS